MPTQAPEPPAPGFSAPGVGDYDIPPIFEGVPVLQYLDKITILLILSVVIVLGFLLTATRRPELIPGRLQYLAESLHTMVRDGLARDQIGPDFRKYVPFLVALFTFILVNNLFGIVPFIMFPTFSHPGMAYVLAGSVWVLYNVVGIRKHGFGGYIRLMTWPPGVPWWVRIILTPVEILSNFFVRPITLSLRLFATMFAGHLLLLVFIFGGEYMLTIADSVFLTIASPLAFLGALAMTFFEIIIMAIQAYIFTALTASYIGSSLADDH